MIDKFKRYVSSTINLRKLSRCGTNTKFLAIVDKRASRSTISIGCNCLIDGRLVTEIETSIISIGDNVYIGGETILDCVTSIVIEDDVLISYQCILADSDNHSVNYSIRKHDLSDWRNGRQHDWSTTVSKPITIGKGAWLGTRSIILKGVTVGEGAVVGAGSVVTRNVPPWTIVAGNPARVIREILEHERQ